MIAMRTIGFRVYDPMIDNPATAFFAIIIIALVVFVVWSRCLLLFPAVAVDNDKGIGVAWNQLSGATRRLIVASVIAGIPSTVKGFVFAYLAVAYVDSVISSAGNPSQLHALMAAAQHTFAFLMFAVAVTVLSLAFCHMTEWSPSASR